MKRVRAKKHLGQHFLKDESIAEKTVALLQKGSYKTIIEVGPGMGVLTKYLANIPSAELFVVDIDTESIEFLIEEKTLSSDHIVEGDFLQLDLNKIANGGKFAIVGNFPYNISSQILFKAYEYRDQVEEVVGMFQKEVAERIASGPGNKTYGILSVLLQAFFDIRYEFTVDEDVFDPPPKVKSAVISLRRNSTKHLECDEKLFKQIVKLGFNQRRKTLRNSLKALLKDDLGTLPIFSKRPEQLPFQDFVEITNLIAKQ